MNSYHTPVLLAEVLAGLEIKKDQWYVDANLGGGGHTDAILAKGGKVLGIDFDKESIEEVAKTHHLTIEEYPDHLESRSDQLILYQANFIQLGDLINRLNIGPIAGILFDLGLSSHQLEQAQRGFSFNTTALLDMRMDKRSGVLAKDLVNGLHEGELVALFSKLGEEPLARIIAHKIVQERAVKPIETTTDLAQVVLSVKKRLPSSKIHPATQVFQALRIAVNDELNSLRDVLPQALANLAPGGRIIVISFHSLEDRIVKQFFKESENQNLGKMLTKKPLEASPEELNKNPRARSAKLRIFEKS